MVKILPIGHLIGIDKNGYLINDCDASRIRPPWLGLVEAWKAGCLQVWGDRVHSLYLRGSVPRGMAMPNLSDLDGVVILQDDPHDLPPTIAAADTEIATLTQRLLRQYRFCRNIETVIFSHSEIQSLPSWQAFLKVCGSCMYGENLQPHWPPVQPGPLLVSHAFDLAEDLAETRSFLRSLSANHCQLDAQVKQQCAWICRRLVRVGFELVMEQEQAYTRDLYPCYQRFAVHFPALGPRMRKALELAIAPSRHRAGLLLFLEHLGTPLVEQVQQTFAPRSPSVATEV